MSKQRFLISPPASLLCPLLLPASTPACSGPGSSHVTSQALCSVRFRAPVLHQQRLHPPSPTPPPTPGVPDRGDPSLSPTLRLPHSMERETAVTKHLGSFPGCYLTVLPGKLCPLWQCKFPKTFIPASYRPASAPYAAPGHYYQSPDIALFLLNVVL